MSSKPWVAIKIAILTVSDSRTEADDTSGDALVERLTQAGHTLLEKRIIADDKYKIREVVSRWIAEKRWMLLSVRAAQDSRVAILHRKR